MEKIKVKVTTKSNLFIGGTPSTFEIGGVDLYTVTKDKKPIIPGSSLKGVLRRIVRENSDLPGWDAVKDAYRSYLNDLQVESKSKLDGITVVDEERLNKMEKRFAEAKQKVSAEYIFGIPGFNGSPKLIFNDLEIESNREKNENIFSIDTKNSITVEYGKESEEIMSNPRVYKTVAPEVIFEGEIWLYGMEKLMQESEIVQTLVVNALKKLDEGYYRLGNSGSRGYGRVQVECEKL